MKIYLLCLSLLILPTIVFAQKFQFQDSINAKESPFVKGISSLAVTSDGENIYTTNKGNVAVFSPDSQGNLQLIQVFVPADAQLSKALKKPTFILIDSSAQNLYVAGSAAIIVFQRNGDGTIQHQQTFIAPQFDKVLAKALKKPVTMAIDSSAQNLYVAGSAAIIVFQRNGDGTIQHQQTFIAPQFDKVMAKALKKPTAIAIDNGAQNLYVAGSAAIVAFQRNGDGTIQHQQTFIASQFDKVLVKALKKPTAMAIDSGAQNLYVAGSAAIVVFQRNGDGTIQHQQTFIAAKEGKELSKALKKTTSLALSNEEQNLVVLGTSSFIIFVRSAAGTISSPGLAITSDEKIQDLKATKAIALSIDGKAYIVGKDSILSFVPIEDIKASIDLLATSSSMQIELFFAAPVAQLEVEITWEGDASLKLIDNLFQERNERRRDGKITKVFSDIPAGTTTLQILHEEFSSSIANDLTCRIFCDTLQIEQTIFAIPLGDPQTPGTDLPITTTVSLPFIPQSIAYELPSGSITTIEKLPKENGMDIAIADSTPLLLQRRGVVEVR